MKTNKVTAKADKTTAKVEIPVVGENIVAEAPTTEAKKEKLTITAIAADVLSKAGRAMTSREIFDEVEKQGLYKTSSTKPFVTFMAVLSRDMAKNTAKGNSRLTKVGRLWQVAA